MLRTTTRPTTASWSSPLVAPTGIKDVKVSLYSMATQQTVATVTDFALTSGTAENGTWENRSRIQLSDLGSHRIDVSASDAGGDTLSTTGSGYFYYVVWTNLEGHEGRGDDGG